MKISILIPYYDRIEQFKNTLDSFFHFYAARARDIELVVIDDHSPNRTQCEDLLKEYPFPFIFEYVEERRPSRNPGPLFNQCAEKASGEILLLTFSECMHLGDVLGHAAQNWRPRSYLCYACRSYISPTTFHDAMKNPTGNTEMHYQHSTYNRLIYFAAAIGRQDYLDVGGVDPGYGDGDSFEDNDFVEILARENFALVAVDRPEVAHQPHQRFRDHNGFERNAQRFVQRWGHGPRVFPA